MIVSILIVSMLAQSTVISMDNLTAPLVWMQILVRYVVICSIVLSIFLQESSWCSALHSPLHVCTTCCGLSPTFCSQHLFGAVKCKKGFWLVSKPPKNRFTSGPSGWSEASCHGGSKLNMHHRQTLAIFSLYFWCDTSKTEPTPNS